MALVCRCVLCSLVLLFCERLYFFCSYFSRSAIYQIISVLCNVAFDVLPN